ncbi:MAG: hypothetical protein E7029_00500 [Planctomycetaceae bacterium]|nr:hypothetical protein [Planctomycetaceae bacterium]
MSQIQKPAPPAAPSIPQTASGSSARPAVQPTAKQAQEGTFSHESFSREKKGQDPSGSAPRETFWSSWGVSLFFHALLFLLLTFTITQTVSESEKGLTEEETAEVGIAFKTVSQEKVLYESAADSSDHSESSSNSPESSELQEETSQKTEAEIVAELSSALENTDSPEIPDVPVSAPGLAPSTGNGSSGLDRVTDGLGDVAGIGIGTFDGFGKGTVSCFGTTGEGNTFVFLFDRSASMEYRPTQSSPSLMNAAKRELRRSLRMLQSNQQFQIIFYCGLEEDFLQYEKDRLLFATRENIANAERFLNSIMPFGGTDHRTALLRALNQRPDVIFFLTDADENETALNSADLERIRKNASGTQINAIQFGNGGRAAGWLKALAEQNGGQFIYLNVEQLNQR